MKVLLINWDNYPNVATGGVYAWAKTLVESLNDFEFIVLNCVSNPNVKSSYDIPSNVLDIIECPLYGSLRPEEFMSVKHSRSLREIVSNLRITSDATVEKVFRPIFERFVEE